MSSTTKTISLNLEDLAEASKLKISPSDAAQYGLSRWLNAIESGFTHPREMDNSIVKKILFLNEEIQRLNEENERLKRQLEPKKQEENGCETD